MHILIRAERSDKVYSVMIRGAIKPPVLFVYQSFKELLPADEFARS